MTWFKIWNMHTKYSTQSQSVQVGADNIIVAMLILLAIIVNHSGRTCQLISPFLSPLTIKLSYTLCKTPVVEFREFGIEVESLVINLYIHKSEKLQRQQRRHYRDVKSDVLNYASTNQ
ncbi:hypothetical protein HELRODRAFT_160973 [Helobdella robusta]|uniref:Uncharacterized protein n=1 Tax=Helobdella robusta TaxID=6412 RepID=T1EQY1_HELRO|nr:hypothetical protein HELRODRAFT_160973 [Helobdella robusta]ESO01806.1 hypothetical protein HELRODRAFT_160973 [Helobdella robusta]